jgi:uncharacterized Ntn-hydrolase superfamily protein
MNRLLRFMPKRVATFSIAAFDPSVDEWGIAVASKFLAVGSVVPWARAKVGAIATQAWANISFGPDGLHLLEAGMSAKETVDQLVAKDEGRDHRQLGVVDRDGRSASYTGSECMDWAGGLTGDGFAIQGNILTGPEVVEAIRDTFLSTEGGLTDRLLQALLSGDRAGGDSRGRQSAAILLVREGGSYGGYTDRALDLRVDDHDDPVPELQRLHSIHRLLFEKASESEVIDIDGKLGDRIATSLESLGFLEASRDSYDEEVSEALRSFMGVENLEERWQEGPKIDKRVLEELERKAKDAQKR